MDSSKLSGHYFLNDDNLKSDIKEFKIKIDNYEWLFIVTAFALVFGCEMLNSAIEAVVDLNTTKENKLAKIAKDCGSGATLIFCIMSLIVALIIFIPKMF